MQRRYSSRRRELLLGEGAAVDRGLRRRSLQAAALLPSARRMCSNGWKAVAMWTEGIRGRRPESLKVGGAVVASGSRGQSKQAGVLLTSARRVCFSG